MDKYPHVWIILSPVGLVVKVFGCRKGADEFLDKMHLENPGDTFDILVKELWM